MGKRREIKQLALVRTCPLCGREYVLSSRHNLCPRCRMRDLCPECGVPKMLNSSACDDCFDRSGPNNGQWRGGRRNQGGYMMRIANWHPRSKSSNGYVFEHILVMEASIGRYLEPGETVHHINGIKDDNRLENLELWCKPQPSCIRAEDALAWAHEVIRRYDGVEFMTRSDPSQIATGH